jgi:hypothetical protein
MAGKVKSIYLTIHPKNSLTAVFHKVFFEAKSYNQFVNSEEFKARWPTTEYMIVKEIY